MCLKADQRLIGYISYNDVDENKRLDLGHLFHSEFHCDDYDTEALGRLIDHAFTHQDIQSIHADNAEDWTVQLASLKKLGFKLKPPPPGPVKKASFHQDEHGNPIEFVGCRMEITKVDWLRRSRGETPVKVKTDGTKVYLAGVEPMEWAKCYLTDVRVTTVAAAAGADKPDDPQDPGKAAKGREQVLEISTSVTGNLFYHDDPMRFEFLLYNPEGAMAALESPVIAYDITDYEHFHVAAGTLPFRAAEPLEIPGALRRRKPDRTRNLHLSALIPDAAAKAAGRELFLHARIVDGDETIAEDTITYGVVSPRRTDPSQYDKSRFIAFTEGGGLRNTESKHERQSLAGKRGISMTQTWDYKGWKEAQPERGGPITIEPGPEFPKLVYCPNLEQIRGRKPAHRWGDMSSMAPAWAAVDDPLRTGCKTLDGSVSRRGHARSAGIAL